MELENGIHLFSGICDTTVSCGYDDRDSANGYIVQIDGKNYCIYEDPDDGYRSYGVFCETAQECTNTFPAQKVMIEVYDTGWVDQEDYGEYKRSGMKIANPDDGSLILEIATQWYDSYYPMACLSYHPENMPVNKQKSNDSGIVISVIARWYSEAEGAVKVLGIIPGSNEIVEGIFQENGLAFSKNKMLELHPLLDDLIKN